MAWYFIVLISIASVALWITLSCVFYIQFFKRFYDIVCSLVALIVLLPLFLVLSIVGAIELKGNPFFTQKRPGYKEKIFNLLKFRTMTNEKDENENFLPDEVRLTKYGKFLRSTSLDELPQIINIFKGDMSIIGPRPQLVKDMVFMTAEQRKRHTVKPGLSGLAQVRGRNAISWENKLSTDLEYIQNITFFGDLKIIFQTVEKLIKREDVTQEGMETAEDYGDYLVRKEAIDIIEYLKLQNRAKELINAD